MVMVLCLLDVYRSQIDRMSEPQLVQENGETSTAQPESGRPTWGVIHRAPLPDDTNNWPKVPGGSVPVPQDKPRSPWGAINRPIEW